MIQDLSTVEDTTIFINESTNRSCFSEVIYSKLELKQPILSDTFRTTQKKLLFLHLYPTCMVSSDTEQLLPQNKVKVLWFTFNTTFFVSIKNGIQAKKYSALKFINMDNRKSQSFYSQQSNIINKWAAILLNYINQIGIQQNYKTIKHLGKGVSADVYLAQRISDKKLFAIKVFNKTKNNERCLNAFINQLKLMRLLNHPNIIKLYGVFVSNEFIYAILQYLSGGNLYEELKDMKNITKQQQFRMIKNLSEGIQHIRQKRVVHRDLKLQNILIRKNESFKQYVICDFGLSTWLDQKEYIFEKCGTPGYIAPEILKLKKQQKINLSNKMDIYSLGSIFHVILLLRPLFPFQGDFKQLLKLNKKSQLNWYQSCYNKLTQNQLLMLQMMLQSNPQKRINSQTLLKLNYFKRKHIRHNTYTQTNQYKKSNIQSNVVSQKIIRNNDQKSGSRVKQQRQTSLKRNSLSRQIVFERSDSQKHNHSKSSIFDIFRSSKNKSKANDSDIKTSKQDIKLISSTSIVQNKEKERPRKNSALSFLFKR